MGPLLFNTKMKNVYIIGCGGVCSYFLPCFLKTVNYDKKLKNSNIILVDGDRLEEKNLLRQNFDGISDSHSAPYKAEALCDYYGQIYTDLNIDCINEYLVDSFCVETNSLVFCFVDNHPARKDVLSILDTFQSSGIFAANSSISSHAYFYDYKMNGTEMDPRIRYTDILTVETGSPVRAAGCDTKERLEEVPQTAIANQMAATHALFLWNFWVNEKQKLNKDQTYDYWPVELMNNFSKLTTITTGNLK